MNLALRDIRYHRGRFILTAIGLGLLIGVVISMGGIYRGLFADALAVFDSTKADIWVVQQETNGPFAENSRIPEDIKYRIQAVPGVAKASPLSFQTIQIERLGKPFRFFLIGYDPNGFGGPPEIIAGRNIRQKHFEMVVAKAMGMEIGEKIHLGLNDYTVVGITGKVVSSGGDPAAYVSLADAQEIQFKKDNNAIRNDRERIAANLADFQTLSPAQSKFLQQNITGITESTHTVNTIVARLAPGADLWEVQERISRWNHFRPISAEEQTRILTKGMIEKARMQLGLFRLILLVISAVIISLIIYTSTIDKIKVIATLKLIGAQNRVIIGMILQQSLLMGVIAYAIGYVLILLTYEKFPRRIVLEAFDLQALFVIVIAICTISSFVGIRKALKVEPAEALGG
ncbi:ABC transporter permease [Geobacter argillaceus]|uniref:Putative ABC transport system permease protein n=1 Tax=Geobacter argillaceus TaxID=345631 RepID=A0A562V827_9BACT|nr:ABC transporter permease [Geobacter argillaceus]TWJ14064.1 putative ABC transport system permease protein [Geobacter argillaceus]